MICGTYEEREAAWRYIYVESGWCNVAKRVLRQEGFFSADADEAIQDAVITFDRKAREKQIPESAPLKAYFIGICKGRAYVGKRSQQHILLAADIGIFENGAMAPNPESLVLKAEHQEIIKRLLGYLDEHCRQLLEHYMLSFSMKEIKDEMALKSDAATRKSAFDCRKKFATLLDKNPIWKQYFSGNKQGQ